MAVTEQRSPFATAASVWSRIVVGVDGTESGFEACRQAGRLVTPDGSIELLAAVDSGATIRAGFAGPAILEQLEHEAEVALREAKRIVRRVSSSRIVRGPPTTSLLHELIDERATLIALGTHGHRRFAEILLGGVSGELLHAAPCSVLIARLPVAEALFPHRIVVGFDGSPQAHDALAVGNELVDRFGGQLRVVTGLRGKDLDVDHIRWRVPEVELYDASPVDALLHAASDADVLIVGSRRLRGPRALGSISERVAHRAASSVLVVHCPLE